MVKTIDNRPTRQDRTETETETETKTKTETKKNNCCRNITFLFKSTILIFHQKSVLLNRKRRACVKVT